MGAVMEVTETPPHTANKRIKKLTRRRPGQVALEGSKCEDDAGAFCTQSGAPQTTNRVLPQAAGKITSTKRAYGAKKSALYPTKRANEWTNAIRFLGQRI